MIDSKRLVANRILSGGSLFVHFDPRHRALDDGLVVPPWLRYQESLVLQFGLNLPIPIHDLKVDDAGIRGTLSFSRTPVFCNIPWPRVFALLGDTDTGGVWPESMPGGLKERLARAEQGSGVRRLHAVDGPKSVSKHPARRGHLRLVKPPTGGSGGSSGPDAA